MRFTLETNHKQLVLLLGDKESDQLPPRVLRSRLRLARFDSLIVHVPGKFLYTANALSRDPLPPSQGKLIEEGNEILESLIIADVNSLPASKSKLDDYREAQQTDPICSEVIRFCRNSWPQKKEVKESFIPFWNKQGELTICGGLLLIEKHIAIPKCKQYESLLKIHEGHQGIKMLHESTSSSVVARHAP